MEYHHLTSSEKIEIISHQVAAIISNSSLVRYGSEIGESRLDLNKAEDREKIVQEAIRMSKLIIKNS